MNIAAVRDDGALLVLGNGEQAAIVLDGQVHMTTRGAAVARGYWSEPTGSDTLSDELWMRLDRQFSEVSER